MEKEDDFREKVREADIFAELTEKKGTTLFLGSYSLPEVKAILKKRNFFKDAKKRKLWPLEFHLDSTEFPPLQRFQVFFKQKKPENLIVDLKIREGKFSLKNESDLNFSPAEFDFLIIEWLTLQNPLIDFKEGKSPLPGQTHPGLNLGKKVLDIFIHLGKIRKKQGILVFPAYFHNALLFLRYFHFLNPQKEAEVISIQKGFPQLSFKQLAWIVHLNCLKDSKQRRYEWKAAAQVYPLERVLKKYFEKKEYKRRVKETQEKMRFFIDWECFKEKYGEKRVIHEEERKK